MELHKFFSSSVCKSKLRSSQQELYQKVQDENNDSSDNDTDCSESSDSELDNPIENKPHDLNETDMTQDDAKILYCNILIEAVIEALEKRVPEQEIQLYKSRLLTSTE